MKKTISILLCSILTVSLMTGCSSKPSAGSSDEKKVTLKFMHFKGDQSEGMQVLIDKYQEEHPNVTLDVDGEKWDNYDTMLRTKVASGDVIDIMMLKPGDYTNKFAKAGDLLDLTNESFMKNVQQSAIQADAFEGKNYALPVDNSPIAVFYNKKIFKNLGIEVPKTYSELMADADKIQKSGITPFALGWKDSWILQMWAARDGLLQSFANNPNWGKDQQAGKLNFADSQEWLNMVNHAKDFYKYGNKDQFGVDYNGANDLFAAGKAAMTYEGLWVVAEMEKRNPDFAKNDLGIFAYPATDNADSIKLEATGDATLAVSSKTQNKEEALKFLQWMSSKEAGDLWVDNIKTLSMVTGSKTDFSPSLKDLKPYFDAGKTYDVYTMFNQLPGGWDGEIQAYLGQDLSGNINDKQVLQLQDKLMDKIKNSTK